MSFPTRIAVAALLLLLAAGCSNLRDQSYDVMVINRTARPLTVGLVKNGPEFEWTWAAPEDIAVQHPAARGVHWGAIVAPGATGELTNTGRFARGVMAVLRVYAGVREFDEMLAMGREDADRVNVLVPPGHGAVIVVERNNQLEALYKRPMPAPPAP